MSEYIEFVGLFKKYAEAAQNFKCIILYGWDWEKGGGTYFEWLMKHYYDLSFDYIIDDVETSYGKSIYRHNLFEYIDKKETLIFATKEISVLQKYGFVINENLYDVRRDIGIDTIGYYDWLEKNKNIDIIRRNTKINIKDVCKDGRDYAVSRGIGMAVVCEYLSKTYPYENILDIGCGKGAAIMMFKAFGYDIVDGLEYLEDLVCCAKENFKKMHLRSNVIQGDATKFTQYENYTMFYLYDPFQGETFQKVILKIEESYKKKKRRIILVYANPWENNIIRKYSSFKLDKQLEGDWFTRMTNIYILD